MEKRQNVNKMEIIRYYGIECVWKYFFFFTELWLFPVSVNEFVSLINYRTEKAVKYSQSKA